MKQSMQRAWLFFSDLIFLYNARIVIDVLSNNFICNILLNSKVFFYIFNPKYKMVINKI